MFSAFSTQTHSRHSHNLISTVAMKSELMNLYAAHCHREGQNVLALVMFPPAGCRAHLRK